MDDAKYLNALSDDWQGIKSIIPYGFGIEARTVINKIIADFQVPFIIDNDRKKRHTFYRGIEIIPWQEAKDKIAGRKIVITTRNRKYVEISDSLEQAGLEFGKGYVSIKKFVPEWYWKNQRKCYLFTVDTAMSTECTFKCKHCNMFMPYYKQKYPHDFTEFKRNYDLLFSVVDYVYYVGLLGGEPLLCDCLGEVIEYLSTEYKDKVGTFKVHTNGSIMPGEDLLKTLKKYDVTVVISNYSNTVPYEKKLQETIAAFESYGVACFNVKNLEWRDVGVPLHPRNYVGEDLKKHMEMCSADWAGLNDGKYYFCNVSWSGEKAGLIKLEEGDFLDLQEIATLGEEGKKELLLHTAGYFQKGYMSFCRVCGGCGTDNNIFVKAGVQL